MKHSILAIDPGTTHSGVVELSPIGVVIKSYPSIDNSLLIHDMPYCRALCNISPDSPLAIEMITSYGLKVGADVFATCLWIGRFMQAYGADRTTLISRPDVKLHLCGSMRANDSTIRQAIIDRYPKTGGGKKQQIGTKKRPGPLYGVSSHAWSALAVGLTFLEGRS